MTDAITDVVDQAPENPSTITHYDSLVGEGKKYADQEQLARAYNNADIHIRELKDDLREERDDKGVMQDVLKELRTPAQPSGDNNASDDIAPAATPNTDVKQMVREAMSEEETSRMAKANMDESLRILAEVYGSEDNAYAAIRTYMGKDEAKRELVNKIGNTDPSALKALITAKKPPTQAAGTNTPGIKEEGSAGAVLLATGELVWSQCKKIKKDDPSLYNSQDFRRKMESASAADPGFFDK